MVVHLSTAALATHVYVIGGTGVGKSRAMEGWASDLIRLDQGIGVIDPHGEFYLNLLARIARHGRRHYERVVLFDPLHETHAVGFNPLELNDGEVAERKAQFLSTIVAKIFHADPLITARMQRILFYTFYLLIVSQLTLVEFERVLTDTGYRRSLLRHQHGHPGLERYWAHEFPEQDRLVKEWTQSALNKVGPLVSDPDFALILGQQRSTIDVRAVMDEGRILLVNLPKGRLGEANSHLMGAFILAQLQQAALSRAERAYGAHRQFTLFIDEFQNYATDDIQVILAESRKYKLSLVMAHQYYSQLQSSPELQGAVLNTVGNLVVFRLGATDAALLVKDLFSPALDEIKDTRKRRLPTGVKWWPFTTVEDVVWRPLDEIWEREMRRITQLPERQFWYKQRGPLPPQRLRTLDMPDIELTPETAARIEAVRAQSFAQYGRSKAEVAREIAQRLDSFDDEVPPFGTEEDL